MFAAYPDTPKADSLMAYPHRLPRSAVEHIKTVWHIAYDPEDVADAAARSGAVFGETEQEICERIDRRLKAPVGTTYLRKTGVGYGAQRDKRYALMLEYPFPFVLPEPNQSNGPVTRDRYSTSNVEDEQKARLWERARRCAKVKGGCLVDLLYNYWDKPTRLTPLGNDLLIEPSTVGLTLLYDKERTQRLIKRRATAKVTKTKDGKVKKPTLADLHTPKDMMMQVADSMFDEMWFDELELFARIVTAHTPRGIDPATGEALHTGIEWILASCLNRAAFTVCDKIRINLNRYQRWE